MRVGTNPQKSEKTIELTTLHRIVVVVYIPNGEGFYADSFRVFQNCLESIIATTNTQAAITVVNNGSFAEVGQYLKDCLEARKIDTVVSHSRNIGKIDALIGAARGAREQYITLTDSDILFVKGWQTEVEKVFTNFKNVGSVSPIPVRMGLFYGTSSVLRQIITRKVKYSKVAIPENFEAHNRYLESINWTPETEKGLRWPVIEKNNVKAIIGSGHQVLTISRDILFKSVPTNPSLTLVGGQSEYLYVDEAIDKSGKMRLSTYHNFAFHMGNKLEEWMLAIQAENHNGNKIGENAVTVQKDLYFGTFDNKFYRLRKKLIKKLFSLFFKSN